MKNPYAESLVAKTLASLPAQPYGSEEPSSATDTAQVADPLGDADVANVPLSVHVANTVQAMISLGKAALGAPGLELDMLRRQALRLLYDMANHLGKLNRRMPGCL